MITTNFNPSVLTTQRNLNIATNSLNTALERMSTGYKVNCAADDAAGMFVSSRLNANIRGLKQAQKNAQDGISILNTAEGALSNMTDILNRLRDLAVQGANGVYSDSSRQAMQDESDALIDQLWQLKDSTKFNGRDIFTGSPPPPDSPNSAPGTGSGGSINRITEEEAIQQGYTILKTAQDLENIRNDLSGKYILMGDIDMTSVSNWDPIGDDTTMFTGELNGNGFVIRNLKIHNKTDKYVGLFATSQGTIQNLGLVNVNVTGYGYEKDAQNGAGGLVGINGGTITNCFVNGNISMKGIEQQQPDYDNDKNNWGITGYVGGLVGMNAGGTISACYVNTKVTAEGTNKYLGGIAGLNGLGTIENVYSDGSVSSSFNSGGIVGFNYVAGILVDSYSVARVNDGGGLAGVNSEGQINNCFWDIQKTGQKEGCLGNDASAITQITGLSTNQMRNPQHFINAGWDGNIWDLSTAPPTLKNMPEPQKLVNSIRLQIGSDSSENSAIFIDTAFSLDEFFVDCFSQDACAEAIEDIDGMLEQINTKRAEIGATINRINSILDSQTTTTQNYTAAKSTIMDADIANESADFVKNQILQQTSSALLAQSQNLHASIVLSLIG